MLIQKIFNKIRLTKAALLPTKIQQAHASWLRDNGEEKRLSYNLKPDSLVWDVGGFKGEFATSIINKYHCKVSIFEPVQEFYEVLTTKFTDNEHTSLYPFGLSNIDGLLEFSIDGDASTSFKKTPSTTHLQVKNVSKFIESNNIKHVDLMKINIEGGEYDLLENLITNAHISKFKNIQVQFHDLGRQSRKRYQHIVEALKKTHRRTWHYYFVWDNWVLKDDQKV